VTAGVAFDLDGCLVDSTAAILPSVRVAMRAEGLPELPDAELLWLIGPPLLTGFRELLRRLGADEVRAEALLEAYRSDYRATMLERTPLFDGMREAVLAVAAQRQVCVVTSKPQVLAQPIVVDLGLVPPMAFVEGPALDAGDEPKTVTLERALGRLPLGVMVGDRHHDVDAGKAHGLTTVGVTWGAGSASELREAGADHVVTSPAELVEVLLG
jgi:phosphoglycolate phosphatase